ELVGKDFDPEENRKLADSYHERMFEALKEVLDLPEGSIEFISGSYRKTTVFSAEGENSLQIILDETFDFWTYGLTVYTCLPVFYQLSDNDWDQLMADLGDMLLLGTSAELHETARQGLFPYFGKYAESLEFTHLLSRAIMAFILFHEVSHCQLDHLKQEAASEMEHDADLQAAQHFYELVASLQRGEKSDFFIRPDQHAAPLVALEILHLHEYWLTLNGIERSEEQIHPPAADRKRHIRAYMFDNLNAESRGFYEAFMEAMEGIRERVQVFYGEENG
ncbi:MAG: hypothetical protein ABJN51_16365, partial [Sneathiella sp.]